MCNNQRYGYGSYYDTEQWNYSGYWKDNLKDGEGIIKTHEGIIYVGQWENDFPKEQV